MTRQNINTGAAANDGTGDTLRSAGTKINSNFIELYNFLGAEGDSSTLASRVKFQDSAIVFEGLTPDANETRLFATDPTKDNTITLPDSTGTVILGVAAQTLTNKTIDLSKNTITGTTALFNTALSDGNFTTIAGTETLTNKTLTSPSLNNPKIASGASLNDNNDNEIIKFIQTGSAVNELTIANGAGSNGPALSATGGGANLNLSLTSKGTGSVTLSKAAFSSSTIASNGAASTSATLIIGNKNSGGTLALSLGDGTTVGEYKIFTNKGSENLEVTPDNFAHGTKFTLVQFEGCTCIWDGSNWFLVGNQSQVTVV